MTGHREIERKFLVEQLPQGRRQASSCQIVQGYFPRSGKALEIRLRQQDDRYCLTFKAGHGRNRFEENISITEAQFRALWPLKGRARIAKQRFRLPFGKDTVELDLYKGAHRGLITAEVEFDSESQSLRFRPSAWFGPRGNPERPFQQRAIGAPTAASDASRTEVDLTSGPWRRAMCFDRSASSG